MARETRRENLNKILADRFGGKPAALGRAVERDDAYIWQLLHGDRNIGERTARHIETKLGLPKGSLDLHGMIEHSTLSQDERELIDKYRGASASWKLAIRYIVALRGDIQDEVSQSVTALLAKVSADHVPDERVAAHYGTPGNKPRLMHEPASPAYKKK